MSQRIKQTLFQFFPFFSLAVVLLIRDPDLYFRSEFWAEDGGEFFFAANEFGVRSLFTPVWGYHFLYGRIVAFIATFFHVYWSPFIYNWFTLLADIFAIGYFTRKGFGWIIPSTKVRFFVSLLIALGPGNEVFMGLCQYSPLTLLGFFLLLEKPWNPSYKKCLFFLFLAFSSGLIFTLIPVILFLFFLTRKRNYLLLIMISLFPAIINLLGTIDPAGNSVKLQTLDFGNFAHLLTICFSNFYVRFLVPFFGDFAYYLILSKKVMLLAVVFSLFLSLFFLRKGILFSNRLGLPLIAYIGFIGALGITAIVRTSSLDILLMKTGINWSVRYFFLPSSIAILIWIVVFNSLFNRQRIIITNVVCAIMLFVCVNHWKDVFPRRDLGWSSSSAEIQETLDKKKAKRLTEVKNITFFVQPGIGITMSIKPE